jgi:hypothetical protein
LVSLPNYIITALDISGALKVRLYQAILGWPEDNYDNRLTVTIDVGQNACVSVGRDGACEDLYPIDEHEDAGPFGDQSLNGCPVRE